MSAVGALEVPHPPQCPFISEMRVCFKGVSSQPYTFYKKYLELNMYNLNLNFADLSSPLTHPVLCRLLRRGRQTHWRRGTDPEGGADLDLGASGAEFGDDSGGRRRRRPVSSSEAEGGADLHGKRVGIVAHAREDRRRRWAPSRRGRRPGSGRDGGRGRPGGRRPERLESGHLES